MHTNLPKLTFLPVTDLITHERHDDQRTRPLIIRIRNSGVFRNPPIVSPLHDGSGRYMVLDGANRVTALREMDFPHVLVQVVDPDDPGLNLQNWNHVVWELNPQRFLNGIRAISEIRLSPTHEEITEPSLEGDCHLALIRSCKGHAYTICTQADNLEIRVELLNRIVDSYKERSRLDRTSSQDVEKLAQIYPQLSGVVIFPPFKIQDVLRLAGEGYMLPSGITRFTIAPRVLHLNYPLEELQADRPIARKNEDLNRWLQERLEKKNVRYYAEPTFLFDE